MSAGIPELDAQSRRRHRRDRRMGQIIAAALVRARRARRRPSPATPPARTPCGRASARRQRTASTSSTADLSRRADVVDRGEIIPDRHDQIHILINNAGAHFPEHRVSATGSRCTSPSTTSPRYGLTTLLRDPLRRGRARVVNVASDTLNDTRQIKLAGRPRPATLDLAGVNNLRRAQPRRRFRAVRGIRARQAHDRHRRLRTRPQPRPDGVTVNALHPGIVATDIIDDLSRAATPHAHTDPPLPAHPHRRSERALRLATDPLSRHHRPILQPRHGIEHPARIPRPHHPAATPRAERGSLRQLQKAIATLSGLPLPLVGCRCRPHCRRKDEYPERPQAACVIDAFRAMSVGDITGIVGVLLTVLLAALPPIRRQFQRLGRRFRFAVGGPERRYADWFLVEHGRYDNPYLEHVEDLDLRRTYVSLFMRGADGGPDVRQRAGMWSAGDRRTRSARSGTC